MSLSCSLLPPPSYAAHSAGIGFALPEIVNSFGLASIREHPSVLS